MGLIDISAVIVAVVSALGAWAAQRSAAKATRVNSVVSGRLEAEKQAYERARIFDTETIARQDEEIKRLREDNDRLRNELDEVKGRLRRVERLFPEWERLLNERANEGDG